MNLQCRLQWLQPSLTPLSGVALKLGQPPSDSHLESIWCYPLEECPCSNPRTFFGPGVGTGTVSKDFRNQDRVNHQEISHFQTQAVKEILVKETATRINHTDSNGSHLHLDLLRTRGWNRDCLPAIFLWNQDGVSHWEMVQLQL